MIDIENVSKSFNGQEVLRGVDLHVPRGKITVIMGGSGVGKSVLLKHIIGLVAPDTGRVVVDGCDMGTCRGRKLVDLRKKFGMLFQDAALFDSMSVADNIAFPLTEHTSLSADEIHGQVSLRLEQVGLEGIERKYPAELSGGMRKRVGLARALALDPEILLFDEPTSGLDPLMSAVILDLIVRTHERFNMTSVIISHNVQMSLNIADQLAMLHEGRIVEHGSPEAFLHSAHPDVQCFLWTGSIEDNVPNRTPSHKK